jgi:hypothetical protein
MPQLPFRRLRAVLNFGLKLRFNPNPAMRDLLCVGLRLADKRLWPRSQSDLLHPRIFEAVTACAVSQSCNDGEHVFKKVPRCSLQRMAAASVFFGAQRGRRNMRKLALAALTTVAIAVPTIASAEGFGVYIGGDRDYYGDRYYGPRAEYYGPRVEFYGRDRGWHRGWYHRDYDWGDRGVVIRRHYWD